MHTHTTTTNTTTTAVSFPSVFGALLELVECFLSKASSGGAAFAWDSAVIRDKLNALYASGEDGLMCRMGVLSAMRILHTNLYALVRQPAETAEKIFTTEAGKEGKEGLRDRLVALLDAFANMQPNADGKPRNVALIGMSCLATAMDICYPGMEVSFSFTHVFVTIMGRGAICVFGLASFVN